MNNPSIILCDIISTEMEIDPSRVVISNQNWKSPKDDDLYVVVSESTSKVIGSNIRFDSDNDKEIKTLSISATYNVEITSKNTDAKTRKEEIVAALTSGYSQTQQEDNQIRIFRTSQILNLSFIDGRSSLNRYQIPVVINYVRKYEKSITPLDKFQANNILI